MFGFDNPEKRLDRLAVLSAEGGSRASLFQEKVIGGSNVSDFALFEQQLGRFVQNEFGGSARVETAPTRPAPSGIPSYCRILRL